MARSLHGPGKDELTLILDYSEAVDLITCLNEAIASLEGTPLNHTLWISKDTLHQIRQALRQAHQA